MERFLINQESKKSTSEETVIPSTFFTGRRGYKSGNWKFLRVSFIQFNQERFDELFNEWHNMPVFDGSVSIEPCVWSYEKGTTKERPHVHLLGLDLDSFIDFIKIRVPEFKGNANFSFGRSVWDTQVQFEHTIQYIVKDGNYNQVVFEKLWIDAIARLSFRKTQNGNFNSDLDEIRRLYLTDKLSDEKAISSILYLKAKYNQSINQKNVMDRFMSWKIFKEPKFADNLANVMYESLNW